MVRPVFLLALTAVLFFSACGIAQTTGSPPVKTDQNSLPDVNFAKYPEIPQIEAKIASIQDSVREMRINGLSTIRVSDGLIVIQEQFRIEKERLSSTRIADFSQSQKKIIELRKTIDLAFEAKDELGLLEKNLSEVREEIDPQPVEELIAKAKAELKDERYEKVIEIAVAGQEQIIDLQSFNTKARAAAEAASASMANWLDQNKYLLATIFGILVVLYVLLHSWVQHYLVWSKIKARELEREAIKTEIKKAQEDFFVKGTMPERLYHIRIDVFSDMLREITRDLAVLNEEERRIRLFGFLQKGKKFKG